MTIQLVSPSAYFCFEPWWHEKPRFVRAWRTNVMTSETIDEQRNALTTLVRKRLSYAVQTTTKAKTSYLRRYLQKYIHEVWGVPLWIYDMVLQSAANAGSSVLTVNNTADRELSNGDSVILVATYNDYEIGTIQSFDSTTITLTSGLTSNWAAGKKVYPLMSAEIASAIPMAPQTPDFIQVNIEFRQSFRCDDL